MKLNKNCAVRTTLGKIILENYSFTDQMRYYVQVNPLADLVIKSKGKWLTEAEYKLTRSGR